MAVVSLTLSAELHLPAARSLKAKRSIVQSIVRTLDGWTGIGAAEVDHQELWQRTTIAIAIVGGAVSYIEERADAVERHIWSRPDVEVLDITWSWLN